MRTKRHRATGALCFTLALSAIDAPALAADPPDPDPWIATDKALHFGVSAAIASASHAMGATLIDARGHALLAAGGVTLAIGAGKELLDLAGYGDPSWKDFAADAAGTIVGLALAWGVDLAVSGVDERRPLFAAPNGLTRSTSAHLGVTHGISALVFSF